MPGFFKNDSEMTEQDVENEVQKRVQFKLDAFFTGMENRIKHNEASEFSLVLAGNYRDGAKAENYKEAWSHVKAAFIKEMNMAVPNDRMYNKAKDDARRRAVDMLYGQMEVDNRGDAKWRKISRVWLNRILKAVDEAQKF